MTCARYSIHAPIKRVFLYFYGSDKHLKTPVRRWTPAFAGETMLPVDSAKHIPQGLAVKATFKRMVLLR